MFIISRVSMRQKGHRLYTLYTKIQSLKTHKHYQLSSVGISAYSYSYEECLYYSIRHAECGDPAPHGGRAWPQRTDGAHFTP